MWFVTLNWNVVPNPIDLNWEILDIFTCFTYFNQKLFQVKKSFNSYLQIKMVWKVKFS